MRRLSIVSSTNPCTISNTRTTTPSFLKRTSRSVTASLVAILYLCCFPIMVIAQEKEREREPLEMSVVVVNPSKTKTQTVPIKTYLPKEVTPDAIVNLDGLEIEFDSDLIHGVDNRHCN